MRKLILAALLALLPSSAWAVNCASLPFTLTPNTVADATQVMADFNTLLGCANNNLAHNGANGDITSLSALSTPLSVSQGGTGAATAAANAVLLGNGAGAFQTVLPQTSGNVLQSNGTTWIATPGFSSIADAVNGGLRIVNGATNAVINIQPSDMLVKTTPTSADFLMIADAAASSQGKFSQISTFPSIDPFATKLLHVVEQQTQNTPSSFSSSLNTFIKRPITTVLTNEISGSSVAASVITLPAGTYYMEAEACLGGSTGIQHQLRVQDTSSPATLLVGLSILHPSAGMTDIAIVSGRFTLALARNIEIQHAVAFNAIGCTASNFGTEQYFNARIWKVS